MGILYDAVHDDEKYNQLKNELENIAFDYATLPDLQIRNQNEEVRQALLDDAIDIGEIREPDSGFWGELKDDFLLSSNRAMRGIANTFGSEDGVKYFDEVLENNPRWLPPEERGALGSIGGAIGSGLGSTAVTLPGMVAGGIVGTAVGGPVGTFAGFALPFLNTMAISFGDTVDRNIANGLTGTAAWGEAVIESGLTSAVETALGTVPALGKMLKGVPTAGLAAKTLSALQSKLGKNGAKRFIYNVGKNMLGNSIEEGTEEAIQYLIETAGDAITESIGKDKDFYDTLGNKISAKDWWNNAWQGAVAGLALGAAPAIGDANRSRQYSNLRNAARDGRVFHPAKGVWEILPENANTPQSPETATSPQTEQSQTPAPVAQTQQVFNPLTDLKPRDEVEKEIQAKLDSIQSDEELADYAKSLKIKFDRSTTHPQQVYNMILSKLFNDHRNELAQAQAEAEAANVQTPVTPSNTAVEATHETETVGQGTLELAPAETAPPVIPPQNFPPSFQPSNNTVITETPAQTTSNGLAYPTVENSGTENVEIPGISPAENIGNIINEENAVEEVPATSETDFDPDVLSALLEEQGKTKNYKKTADTDTKAVESYEKMISGQKITPVRVTNKEKRDVIAAVQRISKALGVSKVIPVISQATSAKAQEFAGAHLTGGEKTVRRNLVNMKYAETPAELFHTAMHELVHSLIEKNNAAYLKLVNEILPLVSGKKEFPRRLARYAAGRGIALKDIENNPTTMQEFICDTVADLMQTEKFWDVLTEKDATLAQKFLNALKALLAKINASFKDSRPNATEQMFKNELEDVIAIAQRFVIEASGRSDVKPSSTYQTQTTTPKENLEVTPSDQTEQTTEKTSIPSTPSIPSEPQAKETSEQADEQGKKENRTSQRPERTYTPDLNSTRQDILWAHLEEGKYNTYGVEFEVDNQNKRYYKDGSFYSMGLWVTDIMKAIKAEKEKANKQKQTSESFSDKFRKKEKEMTGVNNPNIIIAEVKSEPSSKEAEWGASNKLVSKDVYEAAKERMKKRLSRMNVGFDPELLSDGAIMAAYHIEAGARKFADFSKRMIGDLGENIKPYLKLLYNGARDFPGMEKEIIAEMDSADTVSKINLDDLNNENAKQNQTEQSSFKDDLRKLITSDHVALSKSMEMKSLAKKYNLDDKSIQEMTEAEIVSMISEINSENISDEAKFKKLVDLYNHQPRLSIRTSTSMRNQAYSTPAPLAWILQKRIGIEQAKRVYEPTAGTGMLVSIADHGKTVVNELNDLRADILRDQKFSDVTQNNALTYSPDGDFSHIIMNPPFGNAENKKINGFTISKLDHQIAIQALESLSEDGKAAIIVGANTENRSSNKPTSSDWVFLNYLYNNFNVVDNFVVDGALYDKQGASYPVRVITLDGRKNVENIEKLAPTDIEKIDSWDKVYDKLKGEMYVNRESSTVQRSSGDQRNDMGRSGKQGETPQKRNGVSGLPQNNAENGRTGDGGRRTDGKSGQVAERGRKSVSDQGQELSDAVRLGLSDRSHIQSVGRSDGELSGDTDLFSGNAESAEQAGNTGHGRPVRGGYDRNDEQSVPVSEEKIRILKKGKQVSELHNIYAPASESEALETVTPTYMADGLIAALNRIQEKYGNIDEFVRRELGYKTRKELFDSLAAEQIDGVALAIDSIKNNTGFIIGDQTGVGKGRQAAALQRWAILNGKIPVFFTKSPQLFSDMYGDGKDIKTTFHPLVIGSSIDADIADKETGKLIIKRTEAKKAGNKLQQLIDQDGTFDSLWTSYSQVAQAGDAARNLIEKLVNTGKAIVIMDEAHEAAGESKTGYFFRGGTTKPKKNSKGEKVEGEHFDGILNKAGVVYLSATFAKRPDNMPLYFRTSISKAVDNIEKLPEIMIKGGEPLQQWISQGLASDGQMKRSERDFTGVTFDPVVYNPKNISDIRKQYDNVAEALRDMIAYSNIVKEIIDKMVSYGKANTQEDQATKRNSDFSSNTHNFISSLLLALKLDTIAERVAESYKKGEKPVIALIETKGGFLTEYISDNGLKSGDKVDIKFTDILISAIDRMHKYTEKNEFGENETKYMSPEELGIGSIYKALIQKINALNINLPASPIDYLRYQLESKGVTTGEVTGRDVTIDYSGEYPTISRRSSFDKNKKEQVRLFNAGDVDTIVLNAAGSTGISLHADKRFKNQNPRKMFMIQPSLNISDVMQMFGRILRSGQVVKPSYEIFSLALPAEKRQTMILAKKMRSLNANTSANAKGNIDFGVDVLNKYGDQIAAEYLASHSDIAKQVGIEIEYDETGNPKKPEEGLMRKFLGKVAILPNSEQDKVYKEISESYQEYTDLLKAIGEYDLELESHDDWDVITDQTEEVVSGNEESIFTSPVVRKAVRIKLKKNIPSVYFVNKEIKDSFNNKSEDELIADLEEKVKPIREAIEKIDDKIWEGKDEKFIAERKNMNREMLRDFLNWVRFAYKNTLSITIKEDTFFGVLSNIKIAEDIDPKNPAMNAFKVRFTIGDNATHLNYNYRQVKAGKPFVTHTRMGYAEIFTGEKQEIREDRQIFTGNLLKAYELIGDKGSGKVVTYMTSDGKHETGILMAKKWKVGEMSRDPRNELETPEAAFDELERNAKVFTTDGNLAIFKRTSSDDSYYLVAAKKRSEGGKYFLDENLTDITGDFYSSGQTMRVSNIHKSEVKKLIDYLYQKGKLKKVNSNGAAFSLPSDLGDTSLSPMDYRRSIDPLFDFVMEYTDNGVVNPGKEHEGEYFTGSFISSEFVAYSEKKPQGKNQSDKQYQQYLERREQALDNAEGTPLDEIAAAYVRKFGGDEKEISEQILDMLRDLTKRDLISDRAEAKREVAEHEKEQRKEDKAEYAKMKDAELTNQVNELFESKEPVTVDKRWVQMHRQIYPKLYKTVFPNAENVPNIPSNREMAIINEALNNGKMSEAAKVAEPYLTDKNLKAKGEIDETTHHYLMDIIRKWFPIIKKLEHYFRSEKGKEDLGIFRRVLASPMWIAKHFKDNPVVKAIYQASQDLLDDRARISNYLNAGTIEKLSNLRKLNKEEYKKLNEYLLKSDRDQTGAGVVKGDKDTLMWTVQDADGNVIGGYKTEEEAWIALFKNEENKAVENGIMSEAAADALFAFRDAMRRAYLFRIDTTLRALRQVGLINVDSTSFIIENAKEFFPDADVTGKIDLFELMREMGQRSGYYVPRIRHGRYMLKATKAGEPTILKGFGNTVTRAWEIGKLERAGYKVETFVSNAPSQDMMGQVNPAAMMDIINQATIRANEKMKNDLTFEEVTYTKKDGTKEQHLVLSPDAKLNSQTTTLLKNMGGMFIDGAWHFINSDITVKNNLEEVLKGQALTEAKMQMVMQSAIGASLVDMIRENGAGSSKIQRRTAKGDDVIRGYEEDLEKIAGLYLNGVAGSAARNIMAKKMYAAFGGMCFDREKYIADLIPDGLEEGTPEYYKARLNATAEYYKEVQRLALNSAKQPALTKYMDSYIKDMLRNTTGLEIGLGFLKGLSAVWLLTRPSGALNNLVGGIATNPAVIHGATNCGLMYAAKQVGAGAGLYNQYLWWNKYGKGKSLPPKNQELFDIIHENGWDGAELTKSATQAGLTFAGKGWKWLSEKLLKMFSHAEQTNRAAAIYAAVQALCRQKGIDFNTLSKNDKYKLVKQAKEISDFGNGVYNKGNKLGFTRGGGWGAVADSAMLFQTYSVNYIDIIDNALEEGNLRGAAWLMTITALAGGMKISVIGTILATLAGIGFADDGEEKDEAFYRVIAENMGQGFSNVLKYGVPTLAGVNMSGTYQDLVTDMMHDGLWDGNANIAELPAFSIFRNLKNAYEYAGSGQGVKAAEQFMPSWGASISRAVREANDGVTDRQGKKRKDVHDKYITANWWDTLLRVGGFNPINISEKTDRVYSEKRVKEKFSEMRKDITTDYRNIILDGNPSNEDLADIAMRIEEYNAKVRRSKRNVPFIDAATLNNAVKDKDNKFLKDDLDEKDKKRIEKKSKGRIVIRNGKLVKE